MQFLEHSYKEIMCGREGENSDKEVGSFVDGDLNFVCDNLYFYRFKQATEENARLSDTVTLWMAGRVH